ncbi:MAG: hypothetical protein IKR43_05400 [Lachnospiraceae bacterium]|nr:hypothetical protein [Lachnospiraceae bacterium]
MKYCHHDHHGTEGAGLPEAEKNRLLAEHMLSHNEHHLEELLHLALHFEEDGKAAAAEKLRLAAGCLAGANALLAEALKEA